MSKLSKQNKTSAYVKQTKQQICTLNTKKWAKTKQNKQTLRSEEKLSRNKAKITRDEWITHECNLSNDVQIAQYVGF